MLSKRPARPALIAMVGMALTVSLLFAEEPDSPSSATREVNVYHYRLKGKVRLLFFWVGKDDVGGGQISVGSTKRENGGISRFVEVFFGSNPERVPGGINRWGYGSESSEWGTEEAGGTAPLEETLFEGFMKHSPEQGLSEAMKNEAAARSGELYWYEGIRSHVLPDQAVAEIRKFSTSEDFDYRKCRSIRCGYEKRMGSAPDKKRELINTNDTYRQPYGFLTAVHSVIQGALAEFSKSGRLKKNIRPLIYIYNAQTYELAVRGKKLVKQLQVPGPGDEPPDVYDLVARIDFRLRKMSVRGNHDFTLWFPVEGALRGVPVRILDRPRWWLGIEMNLEPSKESEALETVECEDLVPVEGVRQ